MPSTWCTIESTPGIFHHLVSSIGVKGVTVKEVFALEPEVVQSIGEPLAFIFCFPIETSADQQPEKPTSATSTPAVPDTLFFANQVIANACGTQAVLHALLNLENLSPHVDLGPTLTEFRDFTKDMRPSARGLCISNSPTLRRVHNGFGQLPTDEEVGLDAARKAIERAAKRGKRKRARAGDSDEESEFDDDESDEEKEEGEEGGEYIAYHFVALVPHAGAVWELDGLKLAPKCIAPMPRPSAAKPWSSLVLSELKNRIKKSEYETFSLLMLTLDQQPILEASLAAAAAPSAEPVEGESRENRDAIERQLRELHEERAGYDREQARARANYLPFIGAFLERLAVRAPAAVVENMVDQHMETLDQ
ncbi:hypothetical protein H9P43_009719 [Blastocladiella emersonii ATCC 22665]|nr:hypothetical protein H9P43_009683 [Blastocladiella emersonii ATCC 22665]KAI9151104.1 hypothetical protein H9P43_009719 [Blastocladiella emersonii ATCC 22665]